MALGPIVGQVSIKAAPDTRGFRDDLRDKLRRIEKQIKPIQVKTKVDTLQLRRELLSAVRDTNVTTRGNDAYRVKVGLKVDEANLEKVRKELERWRDKLSPLEVEVRPKMLTGAVSLVRTRLEILTRPRTVPIIPEVSNVAYAKAAAAIAALSGGRALADVGEDFLDFVGGLDRALPRLATMSTVLLNITGYAMTAASNTLTFAASLATTAQAGLALPGILGGIAFGLGATFAVLKDFKKELPEVGKRFKALQDSMSERFWRIAKEPIRDFINNLFPEFESGMNRTATSLGKFFKSLAGSSSGVLRGEIGSMFDDLNESIEIAAKHTRSFVGIIEKLGSLGAKQLPKLAGYVGDIADRFDNWLGRNEASGRLQEMIDNGVQALQDLGGVIAETSRLFAGLAKAAEAAGGSTLATARNSLKAAADTVNSPEFQNGMTRAFIGAHNAMSEIANESGPAFRRFLLRVTDILNTGLPIAGRTAGKALSAIFDALDTDKVEGTVINVLKTLERSIDRLSPAIGPAVDAFASIIDAAALVGDQIVQNLVPALETLAPKVASIADDLTPLIEALGTGLGTVIKSVSKVLSVMPNSLILVGLGFVAARAAAAKFGGSMVLASAAFSKFMFQATRFLQVAPAIGTSIYRLGQAAQHASTSTIAARNSAGSYFKSLAGGAAQIGAMAVLTTGLADKAGLTNTAMLALAGSIAGLPGAIAGGVIGFIADMVSGFNGLNKTVRNLRDNLADNGSAFEENSKAINSALDDVIARQQKVATYGDLTNIFNKDTWITLASAITGTEDPLDKAERQLNELLVQQSEMKNTALALANAISGKCNVSLEKLAKITESTAPIMAKLGYTWESLSKMSFESQQRAFEEIATAMRKADSEAGRVQNLTDAISDLNDPLVSTKDSADSLSRALDDLLSPTLDAEAATDKWRESIRGLQEGLKNTAGFKAQTAAAAANRQVTRDYVADTMAMLTARAQSGQSAEQVAKALLRSRDALIREGQAAGISKEAITARADAMGLTPTLVKTIFDAVGVELTAEQIKKLGIKANDLDGKKVNLETDVKDNATPKISSLLDTVLNIFPKKVSTVTPDLNPFKQSMEEQSGVIASNAKTQGNSIGTNLTAGFVGGIDIDAAIAQARAMANAAIGAAEGALDIQSPSRVFKKIGAFVSKGFALGIAGGSDEVESKMDKLVSLLKKSGNKGLVQYALATKKHLLSIAKQWDKLQEKITKVQDYVASIADPIKASGSPTEVNGGTFGDIRENLQNAVADAKAFASVLQKLRDLKLNKETMDQLAAAGPEAALAAATAIAQAGQAGVDEINKLQNELNKAASASGNAAADIMFAQGGNIVKGLLAGLIADQDKLERQMTKLAKAMVRAIKRELGIKSPSRVFAGLGVNVGKGFVNGIASTHADAEDAILALTAARPNGSTSTVRSSISEARRVESNRTINYYAAPGSSFDSEEDLFSALHRARGRF